MSYLFCLPSHHTESFVMIIKEETNIPEQHYTDQEGRVVFQSAEVFLVSRESSCLQACNSS